MEIALLHHTPIVVACMAARVCTDTLHKLNVKEDVGLLKSIFEKGHTSVFEHINYNFLLTGFSRSLLQELARHRHASLSVQSTRYCLKRILDTSDLQECFVSTGKPGVDNLIYDQLFEIQFTQKLHRVSNDIIKYALPEALKTECIWTINGRSLQNVFNLRSKPEALWEFQELCAKVYEVLPEEHKILFEYTSV